MPKITDEQLKVYFQSGGALYPLHSDSVKQYKGLKVHADGEYPEELIKERRPSETEEVLDYRKKVYQPVTKLPINKVINSFSKIRRSPDWLISYPKTTGGKIPEDESLQKYCDENLPGHVSITNWLFGTVTKQILVDANAVIAVIPLEEINTTTFCKPVPILFNCDQILEFDEINQFAILLSRKKVSYPVDGQVKSGNRYFYIDETEIVIYEDSKDGVSKTMVIPNTIAQFPVFKVRAESYKQFDNMTLNRSRIDAMVPFLDDAAAEYSDLKGAKIQHLYPLFWYYQNGECNSCNGNGKKATSEGTVSCSDCGGSGKVKFSPFAHLRVEPSALDNKSMPTPPAGYVQRDTAILDFQDKSVDKNNYRALSAVNMQFLDQTPLSISGDAKQVDREELNNTVYNFAEDLVFIADKTIFFINEWRYIYVIKDKKARKSMLPQIPVPQNYDLLPTENLMKDATDARNSKMNPMLIAKIEKEIAAKKFYHDPALAKNIELLFDLDPLPGYSVDEKMSLKSNNAITLSDFIISSYITQFITRAIKENNKFHTATIKEQLAVLKGYAQEKINENDSAAQLVEDERKKVLAELAGGNNNEPGIQE